jgi:hypothetical protein
MTEMYGTKQEAASDPEPLRPTPGVGNPNSPYRLKQETHWREWKQRQDAKAAHERDREAAIRDRKALAADIADNLKSANVPPEPQPQTDDSWEALVARAEARSAQQQQAEGGSDAN